MLYSAKDLSNNTIELSGGQIIHNFHVPGSCLGEHCPVHNPSDHNHGALPLYFNGLHMYRVTVIGELIIDPDDYNFNKNGHAILRNSAKCLKCGDEIASHHRHDFQSCTCESVFVDGGLSYIRHGFTDENQYENTSVRVSDD